MPRLTSFQKIELVKKYLTGKYNCSQLATYYNMSRSAIYAMLKRKGVKINNDQSKLQRKYSLDETYFNKINTEQKAYFLGLLYADGCVFPKRNSISIALQEKDRHILECLKKELKTNKPIYISQKNNKNKNWQNSVILQINSKKISERLISLGCIANKSLALNFPSLKQMPNHLIRHFIRGYFDGDGSLCLSVRKKYNYSIISIISTLDFCLKLKKVLNTNIGINVAIHSDKNFVARGNLVTKIASFGGNVQVKSFLDWIYKNATVFLQRKYNKYLEICSWNQNTYPKCKLRYN